MAKYAVIALSKQSIPNVLFLKQFEDDFDNLIIITTQEAEKDFKALDSIKHFINGNNVKINSVQVIADSFHDVYYQLKNQDFDKESTYLINLTGGTKVTSLAIYEHFREYSKASFFYLAIGKNSYYKVSKEEKHSENAIGYRLSVNGYLKAYNINLPNKKTTVLNNMECAERMYGYYNDKYFHDHIPLLLEIRKKFHDKKKLKISYTEIKQRSVKPLSLKDIFEKDKDDVYAFLDRIVNVLNEFEGKEQHITKKWIDYISGGWFEEYIYHHLNQFAITDIKTGFHIKQENLPNEIDIAFTKDNGLYFIECKTSMKDSDDKSIANDTIFKLDALSNLMGIGVKKYLLTLDQETYSTDNVKKRLEQFRIITPDPADLVPEKIDDTLADLFKIKKREN
ncbi:MAG TPA: DUF1887 family CARF protein [Candidatus Cloacimonadota bacterium]|nr:DUF1887 family CARF protein [Candidatus Cloacimonadales bacterium]HOE90743.1 DUF1887 family CARF protein [Candidatus Cloacimonadota bacterium]